ncbi:MAG: FadD3 family acyl-CoA ligase [Solirubrobacterales bacterium]
MSETPTTMPEMLSRSAGRFGERPAVVDGDTRLTYAELAELAELAQRALMSLGVRRGDRVAVWSPNTFHWIVATLGIEAIGASLVPVNTRFTGAEALAILRRTGARVLFCPDRFLGNDYLQLLRDAGGEDGGGPVPGLAELERVVLVPIEGGGAEDAPGVLGWDRLLDRADQVEAGAASAARRAVGAEDVADVLFTSGTTGEPKGAMSSQRQTLAVAEAWATRAEVTEDDVFIVISPFFHSFGYKAGWVVCLLRGATIVPQITFDLDQVVARIERDRVSILPGPPTIFQGLLAHPDRERRDLSSLRLAVTGAAPVPVPLVERMRRELFELVITAYGLTEAVVVTMCRRGDDPETISHTSGCATAGFEIRIAGEDGRALAAGEDGEIQLRGPNVMLGYLDDPEATAAAIDPDGWLRTGDVGHLDRRGYLTITDRLKDMITVGGFNVYPAEVENVILGLDEVVECAVVGIPDERLGEVGCAYVVPREGDRLSEEGVLALCRERLANYKVPRRVVLAATLPHNAAGKVLKRELRDPS